MAIGLMWLLAKTFIVPYIYIKINASCKKKHQYVAVVYDLFYCSILLWNLSLLFHVTNFFYRNNNTAFKSYQHMNTPNAFSSQINLLADFGLNIKLELRTKQQCIESNQTLRNKKQIVEVWGHCLLFQEDIGSFTSSNMKANNFCNISSK